MNTLSRVISVVFHPLLMATYLFALLAYFLPSALYPIVESRHLPIGIVLFIGTFLFPMFGVSTLRLLGVLKTFTMEERRERIAPFFLITIAYCFATYLLVSKTGVGTHDNFLKFLIVIDFLVITATVITFFYKISIHSIGIWGVLGIIVALNRLSETDLLVLPIVACFVVAGLVMSARLRLNAHTSQEVWFGAVVGFVVGLTGVVFLF